MKNKFLEKNSLKLAIFLIGFFLLATSRGALAVENGHPNNLEVAYEAMAVETGSPELCSKISPNAVVSAGFGGAGSQIYYLRSNCLFYVAAKNRDKTLCKDVVEKKDFFLNGSMVSKEGCEKNIQTSNSVGNVPMFAFEPDLVLSLLGYSDRAKITFFNSTVSRALFDLYLDLVKNSLSFRKKLLTLPNFSSSDAEAINQLRLLAPQCFPNNRETHLCCLVHEAVRRDGRSQRCPDITPQKDIRNSTDTPQNALMPKLFNIVTDDTSAPGNMSVSWETDIPADGIVNWGDTTSYGTHISDFSFKLSHNIKIPITPGRLYHYAIRVCTYSNADPALRCASSVDMTFRTK